MPETLASSPLQPLAQECEALRQSALAAPTDDQRLALLGGSLEAYQNLDPACMDANTPRPILAKKQRGLLPPILKSIAKQTFGWVPSPLMLTHIITTRCNYSCPFCSFADSLNNKSEDLGLDEIDLVYSSIGNSLNTIIYSGGETTVHPQLAEIVESAYVRTPVQSVYIISNAWSPQRIIDITHQLMQRCPDLHLTWSLSIEGIEGYNNTVRMSKAPNSNAWQRTLEALFALKKMKEAFGYNRLDAQLCTVCTPENYALLPSWYALIKDVLQPDKWNLNLMRRSVQMQESALLPFNERRSKQELEPFEESYCRITEQLRSDALSGDLPFRYHVGTPIEGAMKAATDLLSQENNRLTLENKPTLVGCKAGISGAYLSNTGLVGGCEEFVHNPTSPKIYGNVRDANYDFMTVWKSPQAQQLRKLTNCSVECVGCTLESQRNYPAMLVSPPTLWQAFQLGRRLV